MATFISHRLEDKICCEHLRWKEGQKSHPVPTYSFLSLNWVRRRVPHFTSLGVRRSPSVPRLPGQTNGG